MGHRRIRSATAGFFVLCTALASPAFAQTAADPWTERVFGAFRVVCTRERACTAWTTSASPSGGDVYLAIARGAAPAAVPTVHLGRARNDGSALERAELDVRGAEGFTQTLVRDRDGSPRYALRGDTLALATRLVDATHARFQTSPTASARISLEGSAAAMRFIDAAQHRVGTRTALVARGTLEPSRVPTAPARPRVRRGPAVAQRALPDAVPPDMLAFSRGCVDAESGDSMIERFSVARIADDVLLFALTCGRSSRDQITELVTVDGAGNMRRLALPGARGPITCEYDPSTRTLHGRVPDAVDDCGDAMTWVHTRSGFVLVGHSIDMCGLEIVAFDVEVVP